MEKNFQIIKKENESLEKIDKRPVLLVNDIAKLVNSSALIKPQYKSIKIGNQIWMVENLNVDHYRNHDVIPEVKNPEEWAYLKTGAWCYYDNDMENGRKYGKLYNWYAVNDPRGLAPKGWHIPTKGEFEKLLIVVKNDADVLRTVDQGDGTTLNGFSALLAGYRGFHGFFYHLGYNSHFWSSTEGSAFNAYNVYLWISGSNVYLLNYDKINGYSIRCVKD